MNIRLQVRYSSQNDSWMCFRHAVKAALEGADVEMDIDDYGDEHYLGRTTCLECENERNDPTLRV